MGVETRKPALPAPTDSSTLQTSGDDVTGTDLATDISRLTDKTSYSIPEDGSPITITTTKRRDHKSKDGDKALTRAGHQSQTSLLIEYFEAGKGPNVHNRPSVRVKVTPSSARKAKEAKGHIQITEAGGYRKPSYTRRISLGPNGTGETRALETDDKSISSYNSAGDDSNLASRRPPVEIEVIHKDQGSDLSGASVPGEIRFMQPNPSDISSMPPDSMLEGMAPAPTRQRNSSRNLEGEETVAVADTLQTPSRRRSRSLSRERITQKVIEKLGKEPGTISSSKRKSGSKSSSRSVSKEHVLEKTPRRRSSRHHHVEDLPSGAESSLITTSQVSDRRKSGDQYSIHSGTSKSSINNPKLLQTVEDAIRRLILPELSALKHEQKTQQNRSKFERDRRDSIMSTSSVSREELSRRVSKHASAPNVSASKPKVVLNRDEHHPGTLLSSNSVKGKKERRKDRDYDSPSERSFDRGMSEETVVRDGDRLSQKRSKEGWRLRDAAAGALVGGILTHAALKHHDSKSSVDQRERRKKRSKSRSHSRSTSLVESTDEIFYKHDVPPMPLRSEIADSDLTRESILSERTSTPTSERRRAEIREVARGSPREVLSAGLGTPTRSPSGLKQALETHHDNYSRENIHAAGAHHDSRHYDDDHGTTIDKTILTGAVAGTSGLVASHVLGRHDGNAEHVYSHGRGLSPIQSVASYHEESDPANRESYQRAHSFESLSSSEKHLKKSSRVSMNSLSSAASTNFARSKRPQGINLESDREIIDQHRLDTPELGHHDAYAGEHGMDDSWYDKQHEENNRYRDSLTSSSFRDSTIDSKHMHNYTDHSMDSPYLDKATTAQQIRGVGANAEYIHTPLAVESAVASLHDPSVVDVRSSQSGISRIGERSYLDSPNEDRHDEAEYLENNRREYEKNPHGSPLKAHFEPHESNLQSPSEQSFHETLHHNRSATDSPRQSVAKSSNDREEHIPMTASGMPIPDDPLPEIGHHRDTDSDISTNPSIIKGPLTVEKDDHSPWSYQPNLPATKGDGFAQTNNTSAHESLKAAAANMLSAAAGAGAGAALAQRNRKTQDANEDEASRDLPLQAPVAEDKIYQDVSRDFAPLQYPYMTGQSIPTPPTAKDEGYMSADHRTKDAGMFDDDGGASLDDFRPGEDPFITKSHLRHLSGNSHGMASPLYDNAMGRGIDRIQSKDVVALMDHLTVRDAQRNARDTEILVTLVRSAAEMRNSFEDMKKFIAEQDEMLIDVGDKQHDRTAQKIIGGPRPQPLGTPRTPRRSSADDDTMDDHPAKRRSVFRRALKGLGGRSSNDLARIEDMLVHLLDEVEGLKAGQEARPSAGVARGNSYNSYENMRDAPQDGYEPEGQAGTSSTGNHSGYFSNPPSRQGNGVRGFDGRRASQNRVSTVLEGDEEPDLPLESYEQNVLGYDNTEHLLTPTREVPRGGSVPLETPPAVHVPTGVQSSENTPKTSTDKSRKHKSSSSSFFPKISRWSKTTASSVADNVRGSGRRERPLSEISRSGSDLNYNMNDHYDPQGDDRLRSNDSLDHERPPSPLIPSQVSEKPAYHAHRDSLNLQHPQPRPGPTARYQNHLESQAQNLGSPISPSSDQFGSNPILSRFVPGSGNRNSGAGHLSPISDADYSELSTAKQSNAPPRPPKVRDDGPLVPQVPPKIPTEKKATFAERLAPSGSGDQIYGNTAYRQANGSPRSPSGHVPQRKPTGPRPIATSGTYSPDKMMSQIKKTRYRGSPNHIESSTEDLQV